MNVKIEERVATRLACVRHVGPYHEIGKSFAELGKIIAGILPGQMGEMVAAYYDDPNTTDPSELKSDACVIVSDDITLPPALSEQRLARGCSYTAKTFQQTVCTGWKRPASRFTAMTAPR